MDALNKKIIMKKILTILGQEVIIMFNMAVQISFEEITGKPFSEIDTNVSKDSLALAYSAIIANNPDCNITVDNLMHDASGAELNAVIKAISDSFVDWNKVPETLADEEDKKEGGSNGGDQQESEDRKNHEAPEVPDDQKNS